MDLRLPARESESEVEEEVVPLWPHAGRALGYKSRSATYAAAGKGIIKTVPLGKVRRVSKEWLRNKINGEASA